MIFAFCVAILLAGVCAAAAMVRGEERRLRGALLAPNLSEAREILGRKFPDAGVVDHWTSGRYLMLSLTGGGAAIFACPRQGAGITMHVSPPGALIRRHKKGVTIPVRGLGGPLRVSASQPDILAAWLEAAVAPRPGGDLLSAKPKRRRRRQPVTATATPHIVPAYSAFRNSASIRKSTASPT